MPGTITRFAIAQNTAFGFFTSGPLAGNEYAIHFDEGPFGDVVWASYIRWASWPVPDQNFTPVVGGEIASSDLGACEDILTTGGLLDTSAGLPVGSPTWRQLIQGACFTAADGHQYCGTAAVSKGMGDFLSGITVASAEQATRDEYWANELSILNASVASAFGALVTPPPPAAPKTPQQQFSPQLVGGIPSALTLAFAQGTLVSATASGSVPVVGQIPVPQV